MATVVIINRRQIFLNQFTESMQPETGLKLVKVLISIVSQNSKHIRPGLKIGAINWINASGYSQNPPQPPRKKHPVTFSQKTFTSSALGLLVINRQSNYCMSLICVPNISPVLLLIISKNYCPALNGLYGN